MFVARPLRNGVAPSNTDLTHRSAPRRGAHHVRRLWPSHYRQDGSLSGPADRDRKHQSKSRNPIDCAVARGRFYSVEFLLWQRNNFGSFRWKKRHAGRVDCMPVFDPKEKLISLTLCIAAKSIQHCSDHVVRHTAKDQSPDCVDRIRARILHDAG
jgi:hypothetical protein